LRRGSWCQPSQASVGVEFVEQKAHSARQLQRFGGGDALGRVETGLVQAVDGAFHLARDDDRNVDDAFAAKRFDQLVVVEDGGDASMSLATKVRFSPIT
jgi:hypothetical protein